MTKIYTYYCPSCGEYCGKMKIIGHYKPDSREEREHPNVGGELLECPCGRILRWSDMLRYTTNIQI